MAPRGSARRKHHHTKKSEEGESPRSLADAGAARGACRNSVPCEFLKGPQLDAPPTTHRPRARIRAFGCDFFQCARTAAALTPSRRSNSPPLTNNNNTGASHPKPCRRRSRRPRRPRRPRTTAPRCWTCWRRTTSSRCVGFGVGLGWGCFGSWWSTSRPCVLAGVRVMRPRFACDCVRSHRTHRVTASTDHPCPFFPCTGVCGPGLGCGRGRGAGRAAVAGER